MKGLELSRGYFYDEFMPMLRREMPEVLPCLAAGLVGEGSECFGYDDMLSRDHDWGAGFCLWLPQRLMGDYEGKLNKMLADLPGEYMGYKAKKLVGDMRVGLHSIESFYSSLIGCPGVPENADDWLSAAESGLAAAVNGEVFLDNLGEFSAVRLGLLAHYPEDVRLWLLARRCALAAQTGQYNFLRALRHGENLSAALIKGRFVENAAGAYFLLKRKYMPFYKWSYRALGELGGSAMELLRLMENLMKADNADSAEIIENISAIIIAEIKQQSLSSSGSDFLMDHCGGIMGHISEISVRQRPIKLDF